MGFLNGLNLVLLTIAPLVMMQTASGLRQPSAGPGLAFRLFAITVLAVVAEVAKGLFAANASFCVLSLLSGGSGSNFSEGALLVAFGAAFDAALLFYLSSSAAPRKALGLVVVSDDAGADDNEASSSSLTSSLFPLCPANINCNLQCGFGAAFWLVRMAGPMIANIRTAPGANADFLAAAIVCNLQYLFVTLVVAAGNASASASTNKEAPSVASSSRSATRQWGAFALAAASFAATAATGVTLRTQSSEEPSAVALFVAPVVAAAAYRIFGSSICGASSRPKAKSE